tara:strand:+ start:4706 stop:6655 length:1950 start_codon:yes stop_codon:yes gene_type:complete
MTSKSKSKNKSVERTKQDKSKKEEQPEIIQIKQPLSRGNQNANSNKNTQVVQIVFPEDTEIRKVKKKKKGKSSATKKKEKEREELLNQLKQKLDEYDALQEQAQKLKIKIPEEMGIKVINQSDLKTNEDIGNYINDVVKKIAQLQQLLQQSQQPSSAGMGAMSSMGSFNRLGAGVIQFPTLPASRPFEPPVVPPIVPPSSQEDLDPRKKAELDRLAREAEQRVIGGGGSLPVRPSGSQIPIEEGDLVESKGVKYGNQRVDIKAPKGFVELYDRYRRYLENVDYITKQNEIMDGIFHIPLEQENALFNERDKLVKDYKVWFASLDRNLNAYMLDPKNRIEYQMNYELGQDSSARPQDTAKRLLSQQGIKFTEITGGNEAPAITIRIQQGGENPFKKEEDNKAYKKYETAYTDAMNKLMTIRQQVQALEGSGKRPAQLTLNDLQKKLNDIDTPIGNLYEGLTAGVKIGVMVEQEKLRKRINDQRQAVGNLQNIPSSPTNPPSPSPPVVPPVVEPVIESDEQAIEILKEFSKKESPRYVKKVEQAVSQILGEDFHREIASLAPDERRKRIVERFIRFMSIHDPSWKPNPADREDSGFDGGVNPQRRMIPPPPLIPSPPPSTLPSQPLEQPTMDADGVMRFHSQVGILGSATI